MQGHSLSVAASLEVQNIVNKKMFLQKVASKGKYCRKVIYEELKNNRLLRDVRGRGLRFSVEHKSKNNDLFSKKLFSENDKKRNFCRF